MESGDFFCHSELVWGLSWYAVCHPVRGTWYFSLSGMFVAPFSSHGTHVFLPYVSCYSVLTITSTLVNENHVLLTCVLYQTSFKATRNNVYVLVLDVECVFCVILVPH